MIEREQWKGDFTDCCKPGEEISKELYWNFLNTSDPIGLNPQSKMCGFQIREPHDRVLCKDGTMRARYATFGTNNGKYYYLGIFTAGRTDDEDVLP